ncbi:MAG: Glutamate-tRNA ligase, partial [Candidatus Woesebacteria bacterium GW2011_GWB1_44_11b]
MAEVRTRIAPSPTGFAHVGTAYIALFNLAFAKKNKGKFILRIEDTDKKREVKGGIKVIEEGLRWLGFDWDEFYRQSDRLDIYKKYAKGLLAKGKAYEEDGGIVLRVPKEDVSWKDLIRGEITFSKE